jgi:hypothetical protein
MFVNSDYVIDLGISKDQLLDKYWVPECEGLWFKPVRLDAVHGSYTGYWYADRNSTGGYHYHSGSTQLISLHGTMIFTDLENNSLPVTANQFIYVPAGVTHKAEIILDKEGFLSYGTIEGNINYLDEKWSPKSKLDVFDYIELVKKYYKDSNLDMDALKKVIIA